MSMTNSYCYPNFKTALSLMLSLNILIMTKSVFQIVLISLKNNNSTLAKTSLYVSLWITNILYYSGAIYCYVIFVNKPENCFKGKN